MHKSRCALLVALTLSLSGCGDHGSETPPPTAKPQSWSVVALGDSVGMSLPDCGGCTSFVDLWADQVSEQSGAEVVVANEGIPGGEATDVLHQVTGDEEVRAALGAADVVVVTLGINDSPWNRLDDPCGAAPDYPTIEWEAITPSCTSRVVNEYAAVLDQVLAELDALRAGEPTALRVVTVYDAVLGDDVDLGGTTPPLQHQRSWRTSSSRRSSVAWPWRTAASVSTSCTRSTVRTATNRRASCSPRITPIRRRPAMRPSLRCSPLQV